MLYMRIGKYVLIVAVKHPSEYLPIDFVLSINLGVLLIDPEELDHVKTGLGLVEWAREGI